MSLSATITTICEWPQQLEAFSHAGWQLKSWSAIHDIARRRYSTHPFFKSSHWLDLENQLITSVVTSAPAYAPRFNSTTSTTTLGACPWPSTTSNSTFYSLVSTDSLWASFPFSETLVNVPIPASISSPMLWLDSGSFPSSVITSQGGVAVEKWLDLSGNGFHAFVSSAFPSVSTPPLFRSSRQGVQFLASDKSELALPDESLPIGNSPYTYFVVVSTTTTTGTQGIISGGNPPYGVARNNEHFSLQTSNNQVQILWSGNDFNSGSSVISPNQIEHLETSYTGVFPGSNSRSVTVSQSNPSVNTPSGAHRQIALSNFLGRTFSMNYLSGTLYEIIVFNSTLSTQQTVEMRRYLSTKWGNSSSFIVPDKSLNRNNLLLSPRMRPAPSGALFISFPGQHAALPAAASINVTVAVVWTWDGSANGNSLLAIVSSTSLSFSFLALNVSARTIGFISDNVFISSNTTLIAGLRYSLVLSAQNATFSLFVNGFLTLRSNRGFNPDSSLRSPVFFGGAGALATAFGRFDDIRVWRRALEDGEIAIFDRVSLPTSVTQTLRAVLNTRIPLRITTSFAETRTNVSVSCTSLRSEISESLLVNDSLASSSLPYACIFGGNSAPSSTEGLGGDTFISQSSTGSSKVVFENSLFVGSTSGVGGAGVSLIGVDKVFLRALVFKSTSSGSSDSGNGGVGGSIGGSLMVMQPLELSISNSTFENSTASTGGAVFLQTRASRSVLSSVSLSGLMFSKNTAFYGGGDLFVDAEAVPLCSGCSFSNSSVASFYGNSRATSPRTRIPPPSPYLGTFNGLSDVIIVVGSIAVQEPLLRFPLLDALGQLVSSDNVSTCTIYGTRNDSQGILSFGFSSTYTAIN